MVHVCIPPWEMTLLYGSMLFISMWCSCSPIVTLLHILSSLLSSAPLGSAPASMIDSSDSPVFHTKTLTDLQAPYMFLKRWACAPVVFWIDRAGRLHPECPAHRCWHPGRHRCPERHPLCREHLLREQSPHSAPETPLPVEKTTSCSDGIQIQLAELQRRRDFTCQTPEQWTTIPQVHFKWMFLHLVESVRSTVCSSWHLLAVITG